jgi:transposase
MNDNGLRFDDSVPRKVIRVTDPEFVALSESERDIIGEKVSYRPAQRSDSYVIFEYHRLVYKRLSDNKVMTTPAPDNVLEKSSVNVSLLVGLLIDKFCYHLPLYHQHQRIQQAGIQLSRCSLTHWVSRAIDLLIPIVKSQY